MDRSLLVKILLVAAVVCGVVATCIAARWFGIDHGNYFAWLAGAVTLYVGSVLAERL